MREMVLNHVSALQNEQELEQLTDRLLQIAGAIAYLIESGEAKSVLRTAKPVPSIQCTSELTLYDVYLALQQLGYRDEYLFLMKLVMKTDFTRDVDSEVRDRFRGCESISLPDDDGRPLVFCAISDAILISVPTNSFWEKPKFAIRFVELFQNGDIEEVVEYIDNVSSLALAKTIVEKNRIHQIENSNPAELWARRTTLFKKLLFGPDVEQNLIDSSGLLSVIVRKLELMDSSMNIWSESASEFPQWQTLVTNESSRVYDDPRLRNARRFRTQYGGTRLFMWHARYGSNGRIHFFMDLVKKEVEIGYIGPHLPL